MLSSWGGNTLSISLSSCGLLISLNCFSVSFPALGLMMSINQSSQSSFLMVLRLANLSYQYLMRFSVLMLPYSLKNPMSTKISIDLELIRLPSILTLSHRNNTSMKSFGSCAYISFIISAAMVCIDLIESNPLYIVFVSLSHTYTFWECPNLGALIINPFSFANLVPLLISSSVRALLRNAVINSSG